MSLWRDIAGILAKEASYRAIKRAKASRRRGLRLGSGEFVKSNVLIILIGSFVSIMIGVPLLMSNPPVEAVLFIAGILGLIELFSGAFTMADTIHTIAVDKLLDPLARLPVSDRDIRRALLAIGLYWGGLGLPFFVIPAMAAAAWRFGRPLLLVWGAIEGIALFLLAIGIGYFFGSLAPKTTRSPLLRVISTISWLLFFGIGAMFPFMSRIFAGLQVQVNVPFLDLLPPFSFAAAGFGSISSALASLFFLFLSILVFKLGAGRLWRAASRGWTAPGPIVTPREWGLWRGPISPMLMKDLKLIFRNPRMLATTFYYVLIWPLIILFPIISGAREGGPLLEEALPAIALFIGSASGYAVEYMYVLEGEGAKILYLLPISKGRLVEYKAFAITMLSLPLAVTIAMTASWLWNPLIGLSAGVSYLLALTGSAIINSIILANQLPQEPSSWTMHTFSKGILLLVVLGEIVLSAILAGFAALPFLLNALGFKGPLALLPSPKVIAPLEAAILLASALGFNRRSLRL